MNQSKRPITDELLDQRLASYQKPEDLIGADGILNLGHSSLAMTMRYALCAMRYAHLAPDHLQDAVRLGPLALLNP